MVFGSLVVLHVGLHSYLCFSLLEKLLLKVARHLLYTWLSIELPHFFSYRKSRHLLDTWWIDQESSCLLDSFLTARSINQVSMLDMVGYSSTFARHLHLSTTIFLTPTSIACYTSRHLHLSRFTDDLYILLMQSAAHFC